MPPQRHTAAGLMSPTLRPHNGQFRPNGPNHATLSGKHAGEPRGKKWPPSPPPGSGGSTPEQERQNCEHADSTKRKRERNGNSGNKREKAAGKVAKLHRGFRVTRTVGEKPGQGVGRGESRERMSPSNHGDEAEHTQEGFTKTRQKSVTARSRRVRRDSLNLFKIFGDYETPIKPNAKIMPSYPINITD